MVAAAFVVDEVPKAVVVVSSKGEIIMLTEEQFEWGMLCSLEFVRLQEPLDVFLCVVLVFFDV